MKRIKITKALLIAPFVLSGCALVISASNESQALALEPSYAIPELTTKIKGEVQRIFVSAKSIEDIDLIDFNAETIEELQEKADELYERGDYAGATKHYEKIVAWKEKILGPKHLEIAVFINNLAVLYDNQGLYKKAEATYLRALAINEKNLGSDHPDTASTLSNLAIVYENLGLYAKAKLLHLRALTIRENTLGQEHPDTSISLSNLALFYADQGLHEKAEQLFLRALAIREKQFGSDHHETSIVLNNLANLYADQGLYTKAEPLYLRAIAIDEITLDAEHPSRAVTLNGLANLYADQGLHAKAEPLYLRAIAIDEISLGPDHPNTAIALNNLALFYADQEQYAKAAPLYERALAIEEVFYGPDHPNTASTINNLGLLYDHQGMHKKAEMLYKRALTINETTFGLEHPDTALSLNNLAGIYVSQGLYAEAEPLYERALAIYEKTLGTEHPSTALAVDHLGLLYELQGLFKKAEPLLRRGLIIATKLIQRETPLMPRINRQSFVNSVDNSFETVFSGANRGESGAELALFSRLNRQGLLEEIEKRQAQLIALPGDQQIVAAELLSLTKQLSSLALSREEREDLRKQQEELERQLYQLLPALNPRVVQISDVRAVLPEDSALVEFQYYNTFDVRKKFDERWGKARYLALVLRKNGSIETVDLGLAESIDRRIEKALLASEQAAPDAEALWAEVGKLVMQPLAKASAGVKTLVISPDGQLNRLPFAALPAPGGGGFLGERYKLRLVTTGRELLDLKEPLGNRGKAPLVVANPNFDLVLGDIHRSSDSVIASRTALQKVKESVFMERSQQRSSETAQLVWSPLPGTKKEGEFVAFLLDGRLLVEEDARAEAVQQAKAPVVLHIASHAFFLPDQEHDRNDGSDDNAKSAWLRGGPGLKASKLFGESPLLRSGIALAGANRVSQRKEGQEGDDGYLTALEVAQLDWEGTELVVISACESGRGEIKAGEGVYGLKRAIAVSGARSSLLSLWKVDDRATAAFMKSFYEKLKAGQGRAAAIASTQKEFRNHGIPMWRHPYVWAAFQLSGDWRPIQGL